MKIRSLPFLLMAVILFALQISLSAQSDPKNNSKSNDNYGYATKVNYQKSGKIVHHELRRVKKVNGKYIKQNSKNEKELNSSKQINSKMKSEKTHIKEEKKIDQLKNKRKRENNSSPNKSEKK